MKVRHVPGFDSTPASSYLHLSHWCQSFILTTATSSCISQIAVTQAVTHNAVAVLQCVIQKHAKILEMLATFD